MNHQNTKPMDYQTKLNLPVPVAMNYQYGLLNNVIHMNVPIENTDSTVELNIEINNIMKMDIKKIFIKEIK
jgi:hypothetical protein